MGQITARVCGCRCCWFLILWRQRTGHGPLVSTLTSEQQEWGQHSPLLPSADESRIDAGLPFSHQDLQIACQENQGVKRWRCRLVHWMLLRKKGTGLDLISKQPHQKVLGESACLSSRTRLNPAAGSLCQTSAETGEWASLRRNHLNHLPPHRASHLKRC